IITGLLANKIGKRKVFIIIGSGGASIFFYLMVIAPNYGSLLVFRFFQGSFTVIGWQTLMTMVLDLSSSENRGKNLGIFGIFLALAMGMGPVFGGITAEYGVFTPYYISVVLNFLVLLLSIFFIKEPSMLKKRPSFIDSIKALNRSPQLIVPGIFNFVDRLHMGFNLFILQYFVQFMFGLDPAIRGMILGIYALPFILLQYPVGKYSDKHGRLKLLIIGSVGYGIILCLTGFVGLFGLGALIIMYIFLGVTSGVTGPPAMALVGDIVESEDTAMGMGFFNFVGNFGIILGPIIGGILIPNFATSEFIIAFLLAGIIELISLGVNILFLSKYKTFFNTLNS
ncbi:MAG: MFS transporter, partial [Promethearchaeia archaeon]